MLEAQSDLRKRLAAALAPTEVRVSVPNPRPAELVAVWREGGRRLNRLQDAPGIGVYCWAPTEARAAERAAAVADYMQTLGFSDGYEVVAMEAMYSDPDPDTKTPRWYISYSLVVH